MNWYYSFKIIFTWKDVAFSVFPPKLLNLSGNKSLLNRNLVPFQISWGLSGTSLLISWIYLICQKINWWKSRINNKFPSGTHRSSCLFLVETRLHLKPKVEILKKSITIWSYELPCQRISDWREYKIDPMVQYLHLHPRRNSIY